MAISFRCHLCGVQFAAPDALAGKQAQCQSCNAVVNVPRPTPAAASISSSAAALASSFPVAQTSNYTLPPAAFPRREVPWRLILGGIAAVVVVGGMLAVALTVSSWIRGLVASKSGESKESVSRSSKEPSTPESKSNERPKSSTSSPLANHKGFTPAGEEPTPRPALPESAPRFGSALEKMLPKLPDLPGDEFRERLRQGLAQAEAAAKGEEPETKESEKNVNWAARPDPPSAAVVYKKGKIAIQLPSTAEIRLPFGTSHFVLARAHDFRREVWQVFDLRNGKEIGKPIQNKIQIEWHTEAFSPDGRYLAGVHQRAGDDLAVGIWSFVTGEMLRALHLKGFWMSGPLRFAAEHELVTLHDATHDTSLITVWNLQTGDKRREISLARGWFDDQLRPESLAVSPGGKYAALVQGKNLGVIDLTTGQPAGKVQLPEASSSCEGATFSPDGSELALLVSSHFGHRLYCIDFATGRLSLDRDFRGRLPHFFYDGPAIDWLPDKSGLVYQGHVLLERKTGEEVWVFPTSDSNPRRIIRDGEMLVLLGNRNGRVLQNAELDDKAISKAMQAIRDGGAAVDSALPPLTTPNLFSATAATLPSGAVLWSYLADPAGAQPRKIDRDLLLSRDAESIRCVGFASPSAGKVVVQKETTPPLLAGRRTGRQVIIERYDITNGERGNSLEVPYVYQLIDVNPSGKFAVVALTEQGNRYERLDVLGLAPKKHIAGWRPFAGEKEPEKTESDTRRHRRSLWELPVDPRSMAWAAMIDDEHVLTVNNSGKLICWSLPDCKAMYYFDEFGEPLAMSPGRKYLAGNHFGEFRIFEALTGKCVGDLEAPANGSRASRGAFRPDGKELAAIINAGPDKMLARWDLTTGKLVQEIPIPPATISTYLPFFAAHNGVRLGLEYRGSDYLMIDDQYLFDINKRCVIWRYHLLQGHFAANAPDNQTWYALRKNNAADKSLFLTSLETPSSLVRKKAEKVALEDQLVLFPGLSVRVHVDLSAVGLSDLTSSVEKSLAEGLEYRGLTVDAAAPLVFSLVAGERSTGKQIGVWARTSPFSGPFFNPGAQPKETIDQRELVCRMAVSDVAGKVLWYKDRSVRMRVGGQVKADTAGQQLRDEMANSFRALLETTGSATDSVPRYIFADLKTILAGESQFGFHDERPPPEVKLENQNNAPGIAPGS
jgi:hypothetical protein